MSEHPVTTPADPTTSSPSTHARRPRASRPAGPTRRLSDAPDGSHGPEPLAALLLYTESEPVRSVRLLLRRRKPATSLRPAAASKSGEFDQDDLVENAELKGAAPLIKFAGDGATTFNY